MFQISGATILLLRKGNLKAPVAAKRIRRHQDYRTMALNLNALRTY